MWAEINNANAAEATVQETSSFGEIAAEFAVVTRADDSAELESYLEDRGEEAEAESAEPEE